MCPILRATALACAMALSGCDWFITGEERVARAENYLASGDDRAAVIELQNALSSDPDNVSARLMLTRVSLRIGDLQGAEKELQRAIQSQAPAEDAAVLTAEIDLAQGDYTGLLKRIDEGSIPLDSTQALTYRGLALLGSNDRAAAIEAFNAALAADATSIRARLGLAEAFAQGGELDAALAEIDKILVDHPDDSHAWLLKGRVLARLGQFKAANEAVAAARRVDGGELTAIEHRALLSVLVETELAAADVTAAREALGELSRRAGDAPMVHLLASRIAMAEQDYSTAVAEARKVVAAVPELPQGRLLLGAALLANGSLNQAEVQLSELVQQAPENIEARRLLAEANLRLRRSEVAMQVLAPSQQAASSDPQVDAMLGWANLQRGDHAVVVDLLEKATTAQPNNENLKLDLALAYISAGQQQDAIDLLDTLPPRVGDVRRERSVIAAIAKGGSYEAVQRDVERIVSTDGNDARVLNVAAAFFAQHRNFSRARDLVRKALALDPNNVGTLSNAARLEMAAGDDVAAAKVLRELLAMDPSYQAARISLARLALRKGNVKEAAAQLEESRRLDAKAVEPRLFLAALYLNERQTRQANEVLEELKVLADSSATAAVMTGRLYLKAARYDEALNLFRAAAQREPGNPSWLLEVASAQLARGDNTGARESIHRSLHLDPNSIPANAIMIALDLKEGRKDQVLARVAQLKKTHPGSAMVSLLEGDVLLELRDALAASDAFKTSYRIAPSSAAAIRSYRAQELARKPGSTTLLADWVRRQPADVGARMILAQGLMVQGQSAAAIRHYEQVVESGGASAMVLNNLAWLYFEAKDARAESTAKKAYELSPDVAAIADTYGWILVERGHVSDGLPILERAVSAPGASAEMHYHHAVALAKSGQPDRARDSLRKLLLVPEFDYATEVRKLLTELGG